MPANHCPHCGIPLTSNEVHGRVCPVCKKSLRGLTSATNSSAASRSNAVPVRKNLRFLPLFGILFAGGMAFAILQAALMDFRTGGSTGIGTSAGVFITYGILQGMGLVGNKKA